MKWFKHSSNMLDESNIQHILSKHHYQGVYAFFKLMEILAEHFNPKKPGYFLENKRWLLSSLCPFGVNRTSKKMLMTFQNLGIIEYKYFDKSIEIKCNLIKDLADEYTRNIMKEKNG